MTMSFRSIVRDLVEIRGRKSRRAGRKSVDSCNIGRTAHIAPVTCPSPSALVQQSPWANLPAELLLDILQRVEASETLWPSRKSITACAAVCRSWREGIKEVVRTPEECGLLTFPMSLKQPGPRDSPIQCFIRRERATSTTYSLYLGLSPALSGEASKLLLVAKKIRRATKTDFLISLVADDFSQAGDAYFGKLRSNFIGTKFVIYDRQPPCNSPTQSKKSKYQKLCPNQISSRVTVGDYNVATISYELNVLRTRGPRRMQCTMMSIPISSIQKGGTAPTPATFSLPDSEGNDKKCTSYLTHSPETTTPLVLKNKAPRWHEQLQCWCLNFKGRVTVASVKNFQLVAAVDSSPDVPAAEQEKVILQYGKIGKDIFTMDYRYPLSAFQAFAICLSSFDTKPACE